jgi:hypothetical protein
MNSGFMLIRSIIARVIDAGVGQPVGVFGFIRVLVIEPWMISSASRMGVRRVFSGFGPAPEIPGTVLRIVLPSMLENTGEVTSRCRSSETNGMSFHHNLAIPKVEGIDSARFHNS